MRAYQDLTLPPGLRPEWFSPQETRTLNFLYRAGENPRTVLQIADHLYMHDPNGGPEDASSVVRSIIYRLKRKLVGTGWMITNQRICLVRGNQTFNTVAPPGAESRTEQITVSILPRVKTEIIQQAMKQGTSMSKLVSDALEKAFQ